MAADKRRPLPKNYRGKIILIIENAELMAKFITASRMDALMVNASPNRLFPL